MNFKDLISTAKNQIEDCTKYTVDSIEYIYKKIGPRTCDEESEKRHRNI